MGKLDQAEKFCYRYLQQLSDHHPHNANCYHSLGMVAQDQGKYDLSLTWFDKALVLYKRAQNQFFIADTVSSIALVYYYKEDYEQAIKSYNDALIIYMRELGDDHEKVAICYDGMGAVYGKVHKYSDSLIFKQKALSIREKHLLADHADLGQSNTCIGTTYNALDDFKSALCNYKKSIKIYKKTIPFEHPRFAMTYKNMGIAYENMGDLKKAKHYYKKAAEIYEYLFTSDYPDVIDGYVRIATEN